MPGGYVAGHPCGRVPGVRPARQASRGNGCRIAWLRRGIIHRLGVTRLFKE